MNQTSPAFKAALQITRQALVLLTAWADSNFVNKFPESSIEGAVEEAKKIMRWNNLSQPHISYLKLLFDSIKINKGQDKEHYWLPKAIEDINPIIPYPQSKAPTDFSELKQQIKTAWQSLTLSDWENLYLLTLILEKFGSFLSFGESDIALIDIARTTAAVAAAIASNDDGNELTLIAGDLSGIQKFIYTISSDGALKSLRARSFYLELVTEEIVQQLLVELQLPRTNIIYTGGGNLFLLANGKQETKKAVEKVNQDFNKWLLDKFQGKVYLALNYLEFPISDIATQKFSVHWSDAIEKLSTNKARKFAYKISDFLQPRPSYEPCRVCHRDDENILKPLNNKDANSDLACETCCSMFRLGSQLLRANIIVRSSERNNIPNAQPEKLTFNLPNQTIYYHFFQKREDLQNIQESETLFYVNNWTWEHYRNGNVITLLVGNYSQESEEGGFTISANEMAKKSKGIARVSYLRMDVDRLSKIFISGLVKNQTLSTMAGLSRSMSYFFKVYLNSLAENRYNNFISPTESKTVQILNNTKYLTKSERKNLLFIYAGGDDLFVSGTWNEVVEFAFDVYQCFRAYTGYNPDITLSAGISIDDIKSPLYQAADASGDAEDMAKDNGRDSLSLFGQVFKWDEWLGTAQTTGFDEENIKYLNPETKPKLLGVFPFVEQLIKLDMGINYSRNFVRNLLITAEIQEEALKKFLEDKKSLEAVGTRYYLHLPKIAYTLARLPKNVLEDSDFRTSLKNPYNAPYFRAIATWIELLNRS